VSWRRQRPHRAVGQTATRRAGSRELSRLVQTLRAHASSHEQARQCSTSCATPAACTTRASAPKECLSDCAWPPAGLQGRRRLPPQERRHALDHRRRRSHPRPALLLAQRSVRRLLATAIRPPLDTAPPSTLPSSPHLTTRTRTQEAEEEADETRHRAGAGSPLRGHAGHGRGHEAQSLSADGRSPVAGVGGHACRDR